MPDSIRERIVAAVEARLQTITIANGYNFDLATKIFVWRDSDFTIDELPAINLMDLSEEDSVQVTGRHDHELEIEINLVNSVEGKEKLNAKAIRKLHSDIYKALGVDVKWGGLAYDTKPGKTEMDVVKDTNIVSAAKRTITILYRTLRWDPYNQP